MSPRSLMLVCVFVTVMNCNASKSGKKSPTGSKRFITIPSDSKIKENLEKFCEERPYLEALVDIFVSTYTKFLETNLRGKLLGAEGKRREGLPLSEMTIRFDDREGKKLSGQITIRNGVLNFGNASEKRADRICVVLEKVEIPLAINYKMKFISISFDYVVELGPKTMIGSVRANLEDQDMWSNIRIEEKDGSCTYNAYGLHIADPNFDQYKSTFKTTQGFQDPTITRRLEKIINTFILKHVFNHPNKLPMLCDALEEAHVKSLSPASVQYLNQTSSDLCQAMNFKVTIPYWLNI